MNFAPYAQFVAVSKVDPKLDVLSETNNMFRTLCSALILLGLMRLYQFLENLLPPLATIRPYLLLALLLVLFFFSYRKQTSFVADRVASQVKGESK